jgi:hypothetical protein
LVLEEITGQRRRGGEDKIAKDLLQVTTHNFMISPSPLELSQQRNTTEEPERWSDRCDKIV